MFLERKLKNLISGESFVKSSHHLRRYVSKEFQLNGAFVGIEVRFYIMKFIRIHKATKKTLNLLKSHLLFFHTFFNFHFPFLKSQKETTVIADSAMGIAQNTPFAFISRYSAKK